MNKIIEDAVFEEITEEETVEEITALVPTVEEVNVAKEKIDTIKIEEVDNEILIDGKKLNDYDISKMNETERNEFFKKVDALILGSFKKDKDEYKKEKNNILNNLIELLKDEKLDAGGRKKIEDTIKMIKSNIYVEKIKDILVNPYYNKSNINREKLMYLSDAAFNKLKNSPLPFPHFNYEHNFKILKDKFSKISDYKINSFLANIFNYIKHCNVNEEHMNIYIIFSNLNVQTDENKDFFDQLKEVIKSMN